MGNAGDSLGIKSSEYCWYPRTTNLRSSKAQAMGKHTPWLRILTQLLLKVTRKKLSTSAFSACGTTPERTSSSQKSLAAGQAAAGITVQLHTANWPKGRAACHQYHHIVSLLLEEKRKPNPKQNAPDESPGKRKSRSHTREPTYPSTTSAKAKSTSRYRCRCAPIQSTWNITHLHAIGSKGRRMNTWKLMMSACLHISS